MRRIQATPTAARATLTAGPSSVAAATVLPAITELIAAEEDGEKLTPDELIGTCILLLNAGHEATVHSLGNGVKTLLENQTPQAALGPQSHAQGAPGPAPLDHQRHADGGSAPVQLQGQRQQRGQRL